MFGETLRKGFLSPFVVFILLAFFIFYMVSTFAFMHFHILPNGEIIYHSHFTKSCDNSKDANQQTHRHTKDEFLHFHLTTVVENLVVFAVVILLLFILAALIFTPVLTILKSQVALFLFSIRAPPISFIS